MAKPCLSLKKPKILPKQGRQLALSPIPSPPLAQTRRDAKAPVKPAATPNTTEPPIVTSLTPEGRSSPLRATPRGEPAKKLLALRQALKRVLSNRARAQSHLQFTAACLQSGKTPRGLTIKTRCQALLKETTNVEERFERTTATAQKDYVDSLQDHYTTTVEALNKQQVEIEQSMEETLATITERHVIEHHKDLLIKTMANCSKLEENWSSKRRQRGMPWKPHPPRRPGSSPEGPHPHPTLAGRVSQTQTPSPIVARGKPKRV